MNWTEFIDVVSDLIKDAETRRQIYERMLDSCEYTDDQLSEAMSIDKVFDKIVKDYMEDNLFEDLDDEGYDYDDE